MSNYRNRRNYENLERQIFDGVGKYGIPQIEPVTYEKGCEWIGFNYAKTCKEPEKKGVHFFLDDYQFNRLWTDVDRYIPMSVSYTHLDVYKRQHMGQRSRNTNILLGKAIIYGNIKLYYGCMRLAYYSWRRRSRNIQIVASGI